MKKKKKGNRIKWLMIIVLVLFAAMTKPDRQDFMYYLSNELSEEIDGENWIANLTPNGSEPEIYYDTALIGKHYPIFVIYEVEIEEKTYTYLGMFGNFIKVN